MEVQFLAEIEARLSPESHFRGTWDLLLSGQDLTCYLRDLGSANTPLPAFSRGHWMSYWKSSPIKFLKSKGQVCTHGWTFLSWNEVVLSYSKRSRWEVEHRQPWLCIPHSGSQQAGPSLKSNLLIFQNILSTLLFIMAKSRLIMFLWMLTAVLTIIRHVYMWWQDTMVNK